jgi:hypothetical protein
LPPAALFSTTTSFVFSFHESSGPKTGASRQMGLVERIPYIFHRFVQDWQCDHRTPDGHICERFQPRWCMNHFSPLTNVRRIDELTPSFCFLFSQLSVCVNG